ncbi:MAG: PAS domain-containing protein [Bacteroidia bacterium]
MENIKLTREKLKKEAEDLLGQNPDQMTDVVAIFDTDLNYVYANGIGSKLLRKQIDELEGSNLLHLFPQLTASVSHRHLLAALSGKGALNAASEGNITKDGAKFLSDYYPLKDKEQVYAVLVVTRLIYYP